MSTGRLGRGAVAGLLAGLLPFAVNLSARHVGWTTLVWADFAGVFVYGRRPTSTLELAYAVGVTFWWVALLGALFALLMNKLPDENVVVLGWFYGTAIWFAIYALVILFAVPELSSIPLGTTLTHLVSASLWGIALALIMGRLDASPET